MHAIDGHGAVRKGEAIESGQAGREDIGAACLGADAEGRKPGGDGDCRANGGAAGDLANVSGRMKSKGRNRINAQPGPLL